MKRIAVILRGHLRTWHYIAPAVFDFWSNFADEIDYYFVTWNLPDLDLVKLEKSFQGKNLIKLLTVDVPVNFKDLQYSSWGGPGWLSYNIAPYKNQREKTVTYDAVIDTRPDILYQLVPDKSILLPEPNTLYTFNITGSFQCDRYYIGLADIIFIMQSNVYNLLSERYINMSSPMGSHYDLLKLCQQEKIHACKADWIRAVITRPNAIDHIPDARQYFSGSTINDQLNDAFFIEDAWATMSRESKIECLQKHKISLDDYSSSNSPKAKI